MTTQPSIEILTSRPATRRDGETLLPVLIRISAPTPSNATTRARPRLNLSLVLDRSGSMGGSKLEHAKKAAHFAVDQLSDRDRASVVAYDNTVRVYAPSQSAANKAALHAAISSIQTNGATDLHGGWLEGATQVAAHLDSGALNRVLLLTDGLANEGITDPKLIAHNVEGLSKRAVSTSTLGVGSDFNEDLLMAMAQSGDGNFYFIESAADLERIFALELQGLVAQVGQKVSLGVEPREGNEVKDALNDFSRNELGRLMLPPLLTGRAIEVALLLRIAPHVGTREVSAFRLAFDVAGEARRQVVHASLSLPSVNDAEFEAMPEDERVMAAHALLLSARERETITSHLERGDFASAKTHLDYMRANVAAAPMAPAQMAQELADFDELEADIARNDSATGLKRNKSHAYVTRSNRSR
ncbi:hypothetical protein IAD21_00981 [Abditibacteriota bacterium]|nr:hypothetical protein IAD21_00981 [Abditibacteriota bacterium]